MKVISKKISYNSLVSRIPGVIPSLMNYWEVPEIFYCGNDKDKEKYYSFQNAVKRATEYNINASQLESGAEFVGFDINNLVEFYKGNYGLIPSDIIIPSDIADKITDYTDFYVNIPVTNEYLDNVPDEDKEKYEEFFDLWHPIREVDPHYEGRKIMYGLTVDGVTTFYEAKILSYSTLNKWYTFFKEYYNLIDHTDYNRTYENAVDYYNKEIEVKNDDNEAYYIELDRLFETRGGQKMYEWITNNCIIQYKIPAEFSDIWNTTYLYLADAIKWYYWFRERADRYQYAENLEDCKTTDDCCDCTEYIKLGGYKFFKGLEEWINSFKDKETGEMKPFDSNATNSASISIPISLTNSIDDLGEMSIISNDWVEETNYANTLPDNYSPGTVVNNPYITDNETGEKTHSEETYIINGKAKGYEYNDYYENVFNENDWLNYTDYYINNNHEKFASDGIVNNELVAITSYTYSPLNGKIIYNPTVITTTVSINVVQNVCINGLTYEVINGKYVELCYNDSSIADISYRSGRLQVHKDGDLEYVLFNGKRKYVKYIREKNEERVFFLDDYACEDEGCPVLTGKYVIFDNYLYLVTEPEEDDEEGEDTLILNDYDSFRIYPVLDGYFSIDDVTFYMSGDTIMIQSDVIYDEEKNTYTYTFVEVSDEVLNLLKIDKLEVLYDVKTNKMYEIKIYHQFKTIECAVVSGYTDSKLELLRRKEITVDDIGNPLPGYFHSVVDTTKGIGQSRYNTPYDECMLNILYRKGEVSNLTPYNTYGERIDDLFNGNIIDKIEFYYRDINGNKAHFYKEPEEEGKEPEEILFIADNDDALEQIEACREAFEASDNDNIVDMIYCDITYYIGAVIEKTKDESSNKWTYNINENYHKGVKYIDTLYVRKKVGTYYLNISETFTFNYYELTQDIDNSYISDLRYNATHDASTYFEIQPLLYVYDENWVRLITSEVFMNGNWSHNNGQVIMPLFRTDFNMASSYQQNIERNIYIDRGVNAAYEKLLKLQEVRTMEALENLGNSSSISGFKINKY